MLLGLVILWKGLDIAKKISVNYIIEKVFPVSLSKVSTYIVHFYRNN